MGCSGRRRPPGSSGPESGEELLTRTVMTTAPNPMAGQLHGRMPVVLGRGDLDAWMSAATSVELRHAFLRACPEERRAAYEVNRRVGKPTENDPGLTVRAA